MPLIAYIAVVLVSISGILFELDWLTKPKLETNPAAQASSAPAPAARAVVKADGPSEALNPIYPKKPDPPASETVANVAPATPPPADATASVVTPAQAEPAQQAPPETSGHAARETTGAAPSAGNANQAAASAPPPPANAAPPVAQPVSTAAKNQCDVQGCAAAYKSFRAADCTYQPFEGARQLCVKPPEATRAAAQPRELNTTGAARRLSRDEELRDVEHIVRRLPRDDIADVERAPFDDGDGRVIVIRRQGARW